MRQWEGGPRLVRAENWALVTSSDSEPRFLGIPMVVVGVVWQMMSPLAEVLGKRVPERVLFAAPDRRGGLRANQRDLKCGVVQWGRAAQAARPGGQRHRVGPLCGYVGSVHGYECIYVCGCDFGVCVWAGEGRKNVCACMYVDIFVCVCV